MSATAEHPGSFDVTFFPNFAAPRKTQARKSLAELRQAILTTSAPSKDVLPWLKLACFGDAKTKKGSLRHDANVLTVSGCEGDYDEERIAFEDAVAILREAQVLAMVYTSPSHTEDAPRWRVIFPFSQPLATSERERMLGRGNGLFQGRFSPESWTLSQSYYFGSVNNNPSHRAEIIDGDPINMRPDLDTGAIFKPLKPNGSAPKAPSPVSSQRSDATISQSRYDALVESLLDNVRHAPEGAKHNTLLTNACSLGGHIANAGITEANAVDMLLGALPATVKDWNLARRTAADAVKFGSERPFPPLEDRPGYANGNGNGAIPPGPPHDDSDPADGPLPPDVDADDRPTVQVENGELEAAVTAGENALIQAEFGIYQRGEFIVRPGTVRIRVGGGKEVDGQRILALGEFGLLEAMTSACNWEQFDGRSNDWVRKDCPIKIVKVLLARVGRWKLPVLASIINAPALRADGSILETPGYDPRTGLLFDPQGVRFPAVPINPSKDDAAAALEILRQPIRKFPFVDEPSRATALSGMLSAAIRTALPTCPMHGYTAPIWSSGKSMLVDMASIMVSGREAGVIAQGKSEEETEKRLGSILLAGDSVISIDNCQKPLGGEFLCSMLTQTIVKTRILGESKTPDLPSNAFVTATGNNLTLLADVIRRSVVCSLDPKCERPQLREFEENPKDVIRADRGRYLVAALTVLRAFHVAGRPSQATDLGSFTEWSSWVRGALLWLGEADPVATMEAARGNDPGLEAMRSVFTQWHEIVGETQVTVKALIDKATSATTNSWGDRVYSYPDFREALLAVAGAGGEVISRKLGDWLRAHKNHPVNGFGVKTAGETGGVARWQLYPNAEGVRGSKGSI